MMSNVDFSSKSRSSNSFIEVTCFSFGSVVNSSIKNVLVESKIIANTNMITIPDTKNIVVSILSSLFICFKFVAVCDIQNYEIFSNPPNLFLTFLKFISDFLLSYFECSKLRKIIEITKSFLKYFE